MFGFETHMDYSGQKLAEKIFQWTLVVFAIIGFMVGYITEHISHSLYVLGFGCLISAVIILPPWPIYRNDPINWLRNLGDGDKQTNAGSKSFKKKH